jgi:large conductance mechanosensitive channel
MGFLSEFKQFAMRGNVVDMAIGIVIGGAFGPIVGSVVNDVIMPPIGSVLGGVDFRDFFVVLKDPTTPTTLHTLDAMRAGGAVVIAYGSLLNLILNFLIVAFAVFLLVKAMNRMKAKEAAPVAPNTKGCPFCCMPIPIAANRCPHCTSEIAKA